jgi:hypothetical protein
LKLGLILLGLALAGCHRGPAAPREPAPVPDSGPIADECAQACAAIAGAFNAGNCAAADRPRCEHACRVDQAQGNAAMLDVDCVIEAGAHPAALTACGVGCPY